MRSEAGRPYAGAAVMRAQASAAAVRTALSLAVCVAAGGCASVGPSISQMTQALGASAQARARATSIVFESLDGLPADSHEALVRDLDEEAAAFHIAVVPSGGEAAYRIRGYVAAHGRGQVAMVAWAWDVYDAGLQRAVRLSGEERADAHSGKGGAVLDDAVLHRIARTGMAQLADFMASGPPPPASAPTPPAPPAGSGGNVASRDDPPTQVAARDQ